MIWERRLLRSGVGRIVNGKRRGRDRDPSGTHGWMEHKERRNYDPFVSFFLLFRHFKSVNLPPHFPSVVYI
jgi:hypothetical protein